MLLADDAGWDVFFGLTRGLLADVGIYEVCPTRACACTCLPVWLPPGIMRYCGPSTAQGPQSETPSIDAFASGGIVLLSSYAYRYCSSSRAAFFTGRLPYHVHESYPGISTRGCTNLMYSIIPAKLRAAGYTSFPAGKWYRGLEAEACIPLGRGFDHVRVPLGSRGPRGSGGACPSELQMGIGAATGFGCVIFGATADPLGVRTAPTTEPVSEAGGCLYRGYARHDYGVA